MKKFLGLALMVMFVFTLAACDGELTDITLPNQTTEEVSTDGETTTEVQTTEAPTTTSGETTTIGDTTTETEPTTEAPTTEAPTTEAPTTAGDTVAPVLNGVNDIEIFLDSDFDPMEGVTAFDDVDGDITDQIIVSGLPLLDVSKTGEYFLKYSVEDSAGNLVEKTIYVTVVIDPSLIGDDFIQNGDFSLGAGIWSLGLNEGGAGEFTTVDEGENTVGAVVITTAGWSPPFPRLDSNVAEFENGLTYEVTFSAKADAPRPIKVQVGQLLPSAPWFEDYKDFQIEIFDLTTEWQTFTFKFTMNEDAADGELLQGQLLFEHGGTIEGEVSVPEENYNTTVYYDDITIVVSTPDPDTTAPVISGASDATIEAGSSFDPLAGVTVFDAVDGQITLDATNYVSDVDANTPGVYTVTYTVSDEAGNEATAERTITVVSLIFNPSTEVIDGTFTTTTEIIAEVQDADNNYADITDPEIWYHYVAGWDGAGATVSLVNQAAVFDITASGNSNWGVMLKQRGIALTMGQTYKFSFMASSTADRDIDVTLAANYSETFNLTDTMSEFSFIFTYEGEDTLDAKIEFLMGKTANFAISSVTIDDVELSVLDQSDLLVNGNFNNIGWQTWAQDWGTVGGIDIQIINGELVADVTSISEANWSVQLFQEGIELVAGTEYTISFDAKASVARDINLVLIDADNVEFRQVFNLTTVMDTYTYTFTYNGTASLGKIDFEMGNISTASVPAVITFDNIGMTDGTDPVDVVNGDFEQVVGWQTWAQDWGTVGGVSIEVANEQLLVNVSALGEQFWSVQLFQEGIELVEGASYTVVFYAKADVARDMNAVLIDANNVEFREVFDLTTEMAMYAYTFTYDGSALSGKLDFEIGNISTSSVPALITFDSIVMYRNFNVVEDTEEPVEEPEASVLQSWTAYGDYSVEYVLTYGAVASEWWTSNLQGAFAGFDPTNTTFDITFVGENGQTYLFKVEAAGVEPAIAAEASIVADGTEQTVSIDLSAMTEEQRAALDLMVIFAQTEGASGSLTIMPISDLEVEWIAYGNMMFAYNVAYGQVASEWWNSNLQGVIDNFNPDATAIEFTFTGVAGQEYLFKIEDAGSDPAVAIEQGFIATGSEQTVSIDLSTLTPEQRAELDLIIVFAKTVGETGVISLVGWELIVPNAPAWEAFNNISVTETEAGAEITYDVVPSTVWDNNVQSSIDMFDGTKTGVTFTVTGVAGHQYLIKVEGNGAAAEKSFTASGSSEEVTIDLSSLSETQRNGLNLIVVFVLQSDTAGTLLIEGWMYAEPASGPQQLQTPFGVVVSGHTLVWGALAEATSFEVYIDGVSGSPFIVAGGTYAFDLSTLNLDPGTYDITIKAIGDGTNYTDSELTAVFNYTVEAGPQQLQTPFGVVINGDTLMWGALAEATSFEVYIDGVSGSPFTVAGGTYAFDLSTLNLDPGTYDITIKAIGDGTDYTDSELTAVFNYTVQ